MAEGVQQRCFQCKKMGMIRCDGCTNRFCSIHFSEHRQHLDALFERVCNDRDAVCHQISDSRQPSASSHPHLADCLTEIDEWERQTLKMVKQTADRTRQHVTELMMSNNTAAGVELDKLSNEIRRRKDEDDYFEQDIERLSKKLEQIQMDLNTHLPRVRINVTSIDWSKTIQAVVQTKKKPIFEQQKQLFSDGALLTREQQLQLNQFYGNVGQRWRLIYKATRDGFTKDDFHRCCDNKGPTLTVIQSSDGYLFGGYTAAEWNAGSWVEDKTAFIFTLTNPHNILPTKYVIKPQGECAVWAGSCGPTFGCYDIFICRESNRNTGSMTNFPTHYIDSTGRGNKTFTGSQKFSTADIEIYHPAND